MVRTFSHGEVGMTKGLRFDLGFGPSGAPRRNVGEPMRLLLIGDFSGRAPADRPTLATRPTHRLDLDRLDAVMATLAPRALTGSAGEVRFSSLDDFHPDALFARLDLFRALREARTQPPPASLTTSASAAAEPSPLDALLGGRPAAAPAAPTRAADPTSIEALIRRVVAPHVVPDRLADTRHYVAAIDSAIAQQMRELLHDPALQARESVWRGVQWLVSNLDLDDAAVLELHLFDVTRDEWLADLAAAAGAVAQTQLFQALVTRTRASPGARWSALAALWPLGADDTEVGVLAALGLLAVQAGGPLLASVDADAALAQAARPDSAWNALRASEVAPYLGLVAPRVLLRRPYGPRDEPVGAFVFEEILSNAVDQDAQQYLWGSGALAAALLLGQGFVACEGDWDLFEPDAHRQIGDLPTATRVAPDGEKELLPSAERFLADVEAERWLVAGLMPLLSHRHRNAAQLMRFQSLAWPAQPLAGLKA